MSNLSHSALMIEIKHNYNTQGIDYSGRIAKYPPTSDENIDLSSINSIGLCANYNKYCGINGWSYIDGDGRFLSDTQANYIIENNLSDLFSPITQTIDNKIMVKFNIGGVKLWTNDNNQCCIAVSSTNIKDDSTDSKEFTRHPAFYNYHLGKKINAFYIGKYKSSHVNNRATSSINVLPVTNISANDFYRICDNIGLGWHCKTYYETTWISLLAFILSKGDPLTKFGYGSVGGVLAPTGSSNKTILGLDDWYSNAYEWIDGIHTISSKLSLPIPEQILEDYTDLSTNYVNIGLTFNNKNYSLSLSDVYNNDLKLALGKLFIGSSGSSDYINALFRDYQYSSNLNYYYHGGYYIGDNNRTLFSIVQSNGSASNTISGRVAYWDDPDNFLYQYPDNDNIGLSYSSKFKKWYFINNDTNYVNQDDANEVINSLFIYKPINVTNNYTRSSDTNNIYSDYYARFLYGKVKTTIGKTGSTAEGDFCISVADNFIEDNTYYRHPAFYNYQTGNTINSFILGKYELGSLDNIATSNSSYVITNLTPLQLVELCTNATNGYHARSYYESMWIALLIFIKNKGRISKNYTPSNTTDNTLLNLNRLLDHHYEIIDGIHNDSNDNILVPIPGTIITNDDTSNYIQLPTKFTNKSYQESLLSPSSISNTLKYDPSILMIGTSANNDNTSKYLIPDSQISNSATGSYAITSNVYSTNTVNTHSVFYIDISKNKDTTAGSSISSRLAKYPSETAIGVCWMYPDQGRSGWRFVTDDGCIIDRTTAESLMNNLDIFYDLSKDTIIDGQALVEFSAGSVKSYYGGIYDPFTKTYNDSIFTILVNNINAADNSHSDYIRHPAFYDYYTTNIGSTIDKFYIGKYKSSGLVGELATSLYNTLPVTNISHNEFITTCTDRGSGWHCHTFYEHMWISLLAFIKAEGQPHTYYENGSIEGLVVNTGKSGKFIQGLDDWYFNAFEHLDGAYSKYTYSQYKSYGPEVFPGLYEYIYIYNYYRYNFYLPVPGKTTYNVSNNIGYSAIPTINTSSGSNGTYYNYYNALTNTDNQEAFNTDISTSLKYPTSLLMIANKSSGSSNISICATQTMNKTTQNSTYYPYGGGFHTYSDNNSLFSFYSTLLPTTTNSNLSGRVAYYS